MGYVVVPGCTGDLHVTGPLESGSKRPSRVHPSRAIEMPRPAADDETGSRNRAPLDKPWRNESVRSNSTLPCWIGTLLIASTCWGEDPLFEERPAIRFSSIGAKLGVTDRDKSSAGFAYGVEVGLGTIFANWLDLSVEALNWRAVDVAGNGAVKLDGHLSDFAFGPMLLWDPFRVKRFGPYFSTGLSAHVVSADLPGDRALEEALQGFQVGADVGAGLAFTAENGLRLSTEYRHVFANNISNWKILAGIGWWPRRDPVLVPRTPEVAVVTRTADGTLISQTPVPAAAPAEPVVIQAPSPNATDPIVQTMVQDLLRENRALRTEIEAMKEKNLESQSSQQAARATSEAQVEEQRSQLKRTLEEMAALSGQVEALRDTQDGLLLSLQSSLMFEAGSSRLQIGALEELRRITTVLLRFPDLTILVEGHTDSRGSEVENLALSERRSQAVMRELIRLGIDPEKIRALGFGMDRPVADNATPEGRSRNRRVDIRLR